MKERLTTLMLAVGALLLFIAMFGQRDGRLGARNDVPRPTTAERRGNGYHAAISWLDAEGIRSISLHDRFDDLVSREDLPPSGNLLIVTLPAARSFDTWEFIPLDRWIRRGNTLLVLGALSDRPDWALRASVSSDMHLLTGIEFEPVLVRDRRLSPEKPLDEPLEQSGVPPEFRMFAEPQRTTLVPSRPHAYFEGVRNVIALSDYPSAAWTAKVPYEGFMLALAREEKSGEGALWTRPLGRGRIIVSRFGTLFTNRAIGLGDNARLLANIVGVTVGEGGAVLFDDLHQGLGASYDPDQFYKDRRLYITIGVMGALWLIWVLGSTRLRAVPAQISAPREVELLRAAGGFLFRAVPAHAAARRLIENFFRRVNARAGRVSQSGESWDLLEQHTRVAPADVEQLRAWYADAYAGRRVPLQALHNLLVRIDRQMAT